MSRIIQHLESGIGRSRSDHALPLFELADVLVRLNHVACFIVNVKSQRDVIDCDASRIRLQRRLPITTSGRMASEFRSKPR
jgi:hypothetical protein